MSVQISVADSISRGRPTQALERVVKEGVVIRDYLNAEISLGELADLLGMGYVEARDWLHSQGIATMKKLAQQMKECCDKNDMEQYKEHAVELDTKLKGFFEKYI